MASEIDTIKLVEALVMDRNATGAAPEKAVETLNLVRTTMPIFTSMEDVAKFRQELSAAMVSGFSPGVVSAARIDEEDLDEEVQELLANAARGRFSDMGPPAAVAISDEPRKAPLFLVANKEVAQREAKAKTAVEFFPMHPAPRAPSIADVALEYALGDGKN